MSFRNEMKKKEQSQDQQTKHEGSAKQQMQPIKNVKVYAPISLGNA